jgi:hypothetical protein
VSSNVHIHSRPEAGRLAAIRWSMIICALAVAFAGGWIGCGARRSGSPRSHLSFDQIQLLVTGQTEAEVDHLLGEPDTRVARLFDDDVWIWWDYTFLDGEHYAPELRGQVVHLEITFDRPTGVAGSEAPKAVWRVTGPLSVSFSRPTPRG